MDICWKQPLIRDPMRRSDVLATGRYACDATPMQLRQESLPGDESVNAVLFGPLVLAADLGPGPADGPYRVVHGRPTEPENLPPAATCRLVVVKARG